MMRYIKGFNEGTEWSNLDLQELKDFCETYLAYLIDEGFGVRVEHGSSKTKARVELYKDDYFYPAPFDWDEVKEHYIPFYQMLSKSYDIKKTFTFSKVRNDLTVRFDYRKPARQVWETDPKWFSEEEIINDEVGNLGRYIGVITISLDSK